MDSRIVVAVALILNTVVCADVNNVHQNNSVVEDVTRPLTEKLSQQNAGIRHFLKTDFPPRIGPLQSEKTQAENFAAEFQQWYDYHYGNRPSPGGNQPGGGNPPGGGGHPGWGNNPGGGSNPGGGGHPGWGNNPGGGGCSRNGPACESCNSCCSCCNSCSQCSSGRCQPPPPPPCQMNRNNYYGRDLHSGFEDWGNRWADRNNWNYPHYDSNYYGRGLDYDSYY